MGYQEITSLNPSLLKSTQTPALSQAVLLVIRKLLCLHGIIKSLAMSFLNISREKLSHKKYCTSLNIINVTGIFSFSLLKYCYTVEHRVGLKSDEI